MASHAVAAASASAAASEFSADDHILRMLLDAAPWPETLSEVHAEFRAAAASGDAQRTQRLQYLVDKVFPTLLPALNDLTEVVRRDVDARTGHPAAPPTFAATRCAPALGEGQYAATGVVHPVVWLAQRLLRGGADRGVVSDAEHPFCELMRRAPPSAESSAAQ